MTQNGKRVIFGNKMNLCDDSLLGPFLAQDCDDEIKGRNSYESFSEHLGKNVAFTCGNLSCSGWFGFKTTVVTMNTRSNT